MNNHCRAKAAFVLFLRVNFGVSCQRRFNLQLSIGVSLCEACSCCSIRWFTSGMVGSQASTGMASSSYMEHMGLSLILFVPVITGRGLIPWLIFFVEGGV